MTSWLDVLISVVVAILQIAVGVGLALFSVTLSLNLLNRLTRGWKAVSAFIIIWVVSKYLRS